MPGQTITGKAFEYACLKTFCEKLTHEGKQYCVINNDPLQTAKNAYDALQDLVREKYDLAASTAVKLVFPLEPRILYGSDTISLSLNSDAHGVAGDVRDLLCIRSTDQWEIGFSCKHNHEALKHPRITESCDFGSDWVGYRCSQEFLSSMRALTSQLDGSRKWREIPSKQDRFYVPILNLYCEEIQRLCNQYEDVPEKLLGYFFGTNDFYKIISQESVRQTKIEGFNIYGTMNRSIRDKRPIYRVPRLRLPTRLLEVQLKPNSKTTIEVYFDMGWTVKMRLHNKDEVARATGLAWDVQLAGMPPELYQQQRSWDE